MRLTGLVVGGYSSGGSGRRGGDRGAVGGTGGGNGAGDGRDVEERRRVRFSVSRADSQRDTAGSRQPAVPVRRYVTDQVNLTVGDTNRSQLGTSTVGQNTSTAPIEVKYQ